MIYRKFHKNNKKKKSKKRAVIRQTLLDNPDKRAGVSFSCGKDSLLLALLCVEVSKELNRERPLLMSSFVPFEFDSEKNWNQYLIDNIRGVDWVGVRPVSFQCYFWTYIFGIGSTVPTSQTKECNKLLKSQPLDKLNKQYKKGVVVYAGTRNEESSRRRKRFEEFGFIQPRYVAPISKVKTATLWNYLEKNLYKINIDIDLLRLEYANKTRGGCWFCANRKIVNAESLEDAITLKLRSHISQNLPDYRERLVKYGDLSPTQAYRTRLIYCKQWFNEMLDLQKQYGRELITELDKKFIFELWNYREKRNERYYQKDFLEDVKTGRYTMLYPELFDIIFELKGERYVYRHAETFIIRNESGLLND